MYIDGVNIIPISSTYKKILLKYLVFKYQRIETRIEALVLSIDYSILIDMICLIIIKTLKEYLSRWWSSRS